MKQIESRKDIYFLVSQFYQKVRVDELLSPIFNKIIAVNSWENHLQHLTDFWEANLLGSIHFQGKIILKHHLTDKKSGYTISQTHFNRCIQLWYEALEENFVGQLQSTAKEKARKMSTGIFLSMWYKKPKKTL